MFIRAARAALDHGRHHRLGDGVHAGQVDAQDAMPIVLGIFVDRLDGLSRC